MQKNHWLQMAINNSVLALFLSILAGCAATNHSSEAEFDAKKWLESSALALEQTDDEFTGDITVTVNGEEVFHGGEVLPANQKWSWQLKPLSDSSSFKPSFSPLLSVAQLTELDPEVSVEHGGDESDTVIVNVKVEENVARQTIIENIRDNIAQLREQYEEEAENSELVQEWLERENHRISTMLDTLIVDEAQYRLEIDTNSNLPQQMDVKTTVRYDWNGAEQTEQLQGTYTLGNTKTSS